MFLSYVSEASPGYRYVLGARARVSGADSATAQQHRSTRLIAHTEYYYTLCAITATARGTIFSPSMLCLLSFYLGLQARLMSLKIL